MLPRPVRPGHWRHLRDGIGQRAGAERRSPAAKPAASSYCAADAEARARSRRVNRPRASNRSGEEQLGHIGGAGERHLQKLHGTAECAARFYADQVLNHHTTAMIDFVGRQEIAFIATVSADA